MVNIHSFYFRDVPIFSEMPFKFNLANISTTGLDMVFYG